jgi:hypothetical protein
VQMPSSAGTGLRSGVRDGSFIAKPSWVVVAISLLSVVSRES